MDGGRSGGTAQRHSTNADSAGSIVHNKADSAKRGMLVWAKVEGHPHYPGVIQDGLIPANIQAQKPDHPPSARTAPSRHLAATDSPSATSSVRGSTSLSPAPADQALSWVAVQFYDRQRSWVWLPSNKFVPMLEDDAVDQKMLRGKSKGVKEAYERAKASIQG
jgi:hypothetical protein